ncbi:MAG: NUDIX domain-containing protein [Bacteroidales bacterium]|nr:NUDIX domain-containing protein [Bacteroidales bacterium]
MEAAIKFCPNCKSNRVAFDRVKKYSCATCGWVFFQNTAAAVAGILEFDGKILAVERNREPGCGLLDFPGGFVDPDESAEEALIREIKEELGVEIEDIRYLCSAPNDYRYKEIDYTTCDIFFTAKLPTNVFIVEHSEIAGYKWLRPEELDPAGFAFKSMRRAIQSYKNKIIGV